MASSGLAAPEGYLWCRGPSGATHLLRAAELVAEGRDGPEARVRARSLCGLWASLKPGENGWAEVTPRVAPDGGTRFCRSCLHTAADVERALRLLALPAPAEQGRLF
jgi:hypothetical protein